MSEETVDYVTKAVAMVATQGWRLLADVSGVCVCADWTDEMVYAVQH